MIKPKPHQTSLILCGFVSGLIAGAVSAEIYTIGLGILAGAIDKNIPALFFVVLLGQLYGVLPALILGSLLGTISGFIFKYIPSDSSKMQSIIISLGVNLLAGALLCAVPLISGILKLQPDIKKWDFEPEDMKVLILALLPFLIIFLGAATWGGNELAKCKEICTRLTNDVRDPI